MSKKLCILLIYSILEMVKPLIYHQYMHNLYTIFNPLAELNKRIFKSANRFVVNVVYILKDCKCTYFP